MKHEQFKLMAEIMEKIDNQSRLPVPRSTGMPVVDAEVISLIEKTYREQNMPVTKQQISKAVAEVKKAYEPVQGLDYLLHSRTPNRKWSAKKFKNIKRITPGVVEVEPRYMSSSQASQYMLNYGLDVRPYSSRDRIRFLTDLLKMKRLRPLFLMGSGAALIGGGLMLKMWPFWGSNIAAPWIVLVGVVFLVASLWGGINRLDLKMLLKELENENHQAMEAFHEEFAFNFHDEIKSSQPSPAALNSFFEGVYIPSAPFVWNHESQSVLKKLSLNKNIGKIVALWSEEGVAWRQQDFWFFVVLGCHMDVLPSHHWLSN